MKQQVFSNIKRRSKWLGIIDYKYLVLGIIYIIIIINVLKMFTFSFKMSLYIFCICISPVIGVMFVASNTTEGSYVLENILVYYLKRGIYVDKKSSKFFKPMIYK